MRDLVVRGARIKTEGWIFLSCLLLAISVNAFAIVKFHTPWIELLTTWRETFAVALVFYVVFGIPRAIFFALRRFFHRQTPPG